MGGIEDYYTHVLKGEGHSPNNTEDTYENWTGLDFRDGVEPATNYNGKYSTNVFTERAQNIIEQHDISKARIPNKYKSNPDMCLQSTYISLAWKTILNIVRLALIL